MRVYRYASHDEYVAAQVEANKRKLGNVWVRPETVRRICSHAPKRVRAILCHGTRNAAEQAMFLSHFPNARVIGTEISDTAMDFQHTVRHDFHEPRPEWVGAFDLVYSNSWDHSYDPVKSLRTWAGQLSDHGRLCIEIGTGPLVNVSTASDPLEIQPHEALGMFEREGLRNVVSFDAAGINGGEDHKSFVFVLVRA